MARPKGIPSARKGKTYEEIYGTDKANKMKQKQSMIKLGRKFSVETKNKMSVKRKFNLDNGICHVYCKKGKENHFFGKKHNENTKLKIGLFSKGRKYSKESIEKRAVKLREHWTHEEYRKKVLGRRVMSSLEQKFNEVLSLLGFKFVGNGEVWIGKMNPDFINEDKKIVVEVYSLHFKLMKYNSEQEYQEIRRNEFEKYGYKVLFYNQTCNNLEKIKNEMEMI